MNNKPKIGVYICHCGSNIAGTVDVKEVAEFAQGLPSVVVAKDYIYMCSDPGQNMIKEDIKQLGLDRVVVACCSPTLRRYQSSSVSRIMALRYGRSSRNSDKNPNSPKFWSGRRLN